MGKLKNAINKAATWLNEVYQWLCKEGGMLHLLGFICMMLTLEPFVGWTWASVVSWIIAFGKEAFDFLTKRNTLKQCGNDIVRDAIGWGVASIVILIKILTT